MSRMSRPSSELGASNDATRYTLVFINFLFVALGIAAVTVGGWVMLQHSELRPLTFFGAVANDLGLLQNAAILLITSGLVIFALGILGCCGAYRELKCMLGLYIGLILLVLAVSVAACVLAFIFRDQVEEELFNHLEDGLVRDYEGYTASDRPFSTALDYAHIQFQCCGIRNYSDFTRASNWTTRRSSTVPVSCCVIDREAFEEDGVYIIPDKTCVQFPNSTNSHIDTPCYGKLKDWMEEQAFIMGGISIAIIALQLLAVLFAAMMVRPTTKNTDYLYRV